MSAYISRARRINDRLAEHADRTDASVPRPLVITIAANSLPLPIIRPDSWQVNWAEQRARIRNQLRFTRKFAR